MAFRNIRFAGQAAEAAACDFWQQSNRSRGVLTLRHCKPINLLRLRDDARVFTAAAHFVRRLSVQEKVSKFSSSA
jgi:hypothetical protein